MLLQTTMHPNLNTSIPTFIMHLSPPSSWIISSFSPLLMAGLNPTYEALLIACSQLRLLINWSSLMAFDYFNLSMTLPLPHPIYTFTLHHAILCLFNFIHAQGSFSWLFASTPNTRLTLINAVLVASTFLRMIITSLLNALILLNCG